ncbi:MAG: TnsA endonuclease N-terminal domain-containing protein [Pseudomonadota bacterium]
MMISNTWGGRWNGVAPVGDQHSRARTIVRHTGGIVRGKFPSRKNGRMVHHEGLLELDAIYLFEASPRVIRYREQPTTIQYPDGVKLRRYTPDFELVLDGGDTVFIEVKPVRSLEGEGVRHKLQKVTSYLNRAAKRFVILTGDTLRQEPSLSNLKWIYHQAARIPPSPDLIRVAVKHFRDQFPLSLEKAETLFKAYGVDPYSLLLAGSLSCSLTQPISPDTQVTLVKENDDDWFWISQEHGF